MACTHALKISARWVAFTVTGALVLALHAHGDDAPAATIDVATGPSGFGELVEGQMELRGSAYVLTLRGIEGTARTQGSVDRLARPQDISGVYRPVGTDGSLRNGSGVTIQFDPPLKLEGDRLEIELKSRRTPKISQGHREGGVER